jgi:AbrB family looped-hinge helix DNA binding protein
MKSTDATPPAFVEFQLIMALMNARLTIDKTGRIVLPKRVRDRLQLAAGDELELECVGDQITLRPVRGTAQLRQKHGVWVCRGSEPLDATTVEGTIEQVRRERDVRNLGRSH